MTSLVPVFGLAVDMVGSVLFESAEESAADQRAVQILVCAGKPGWLLTYALEKVHHHPYELLTNHSWSDARQIRLQRLPVIDRVRAAELDGGTSLS
jgi:hypothetical protein